MTALHDAATLLIGQASESTIRAVLRMLLNDVAPAPVPRTARLPPPAPARSGRKRAARRAGTANGADAEWEARRRQVRETMRERSADYAALAAAIGRSATAVRIDVTSRRAPRAAIQSKLQGWLEAPEVATPALPFRTGRGNGSHPATTVARSPAGDSTDIAAA